MAMFIAVAAFSFMDALLKTFAAHYSPAQVTFLRAVSSLPFVLLPLWWSGRLGELRPVRPALHLVRALLGILMLLSFIAALRDAPLAAVYSVYMGAPLLIAAFAAWFLGERVGLGCWLAILVGLAGVLVILQPRPDLLDTVVTIMVERFPHLTRKEIMALIKLPTGHLRHTRAVQEWMEEGRLEGRHHRPYSGLAAAAAGGPVRRAA